MFNEYTEYQMMKLRQEETERNARHTWKNYVEMNEENIAKVRTFQVVPPVNQCCQCTCA
ncbi:hypothetical protein QE429_003843 [Bacillus sp. SORGH_AS 510]|uniref:hypothetical protein n=1 Tax=Bacillus sp. SORGH_AS_0510 TaxID=3041771 RepID=UPI00278BA75B|nr:hypothetical protein [Bacillus sp. SORGH_AS_0510]MDQ1147016.1 hypothetical protein [Bacillus sp. SORGH_AS_0510]